MKKQQKRIEKERRRERARSVERQRRIDAGRIGFLMFEAEAAWEARDFAGALRSLEKVLKIRPGYEAAIEFSAEVYFKLGRHQEGMARFEQLREAPEHALVVYNAAVAAWNLGRMDRCKELAAEFVAAARGDKSVRTYRDNARELVKRAERAAKESTRRESNAFQQPDLFSEAASAKTGLPHSPDAVPGGGPQGAQKQPPAAGAMAAAAPDLPELPEIALPEIPVQFEFDARAIEASKRGTAAPAAEIFLRRDYTLLRLQKGFDEMLSLGAVNNVEFFWYQTETVRRVLRDFRGHALLADEVGLGKTIEACFVLKEYWMRGMVRKALILTPPSLVSQWLEELASKFDLAAVSPETGGYGADPDGFWRRHDLVVASLALARQQSNRERLARIDYDLLIIDEAHYLKNRTTAAWQLVNGLKRRFMLLLGAERKLNSAATIAGARVPESARSPIRSAATNCAACFPK